MIYKWTKRFMELAQLIATWSKDPNTQVGSVIVNNQRQIIATGYNGIVRNVDDQTERFQRPAKYHWMEHAERNAIYQAAYTGHSVQGCTMFTTMFPCPDCTRAIIQSGIEYLISPEPNLKHPKYGDSFQLSKQMLKEAKVRFLHETI